MHLYATIFPVIRCALFGSNPEKQRNKRTPAGRWHTVNIGEPQHMVDVAVPWQHPSEPDESPIILDCVYAVIGSVPSPGMIRTQRINDRDNLFPCVDVRKDNDGGFVILSGSVQLAIDRCGYI